MNYITFINELFKAQIGKQNEFVVYGQNVSTGSCLGGLSRGFKEVRGCHVYNVPNTENTLVGMGFGLMLGGVPSAFFMKQQDFLLLGIDHLRNTHNFIRQKKDVAPFSIVNITMDAGFEGIQSSLNNLSDFCALGSCEGYTISTKEEAEYIIGNLFPMPGFRIISVSQRLFQSKILDFPNAKVCDEKLVFQYQQGNDITLVSLNFSLPQGKILSEKLRDLNFSTSLFNIASSHADVNLESIINDSLRTNRLVIMDDSKSDSSVSKKLEIDSLRAGVKFVYSIKRNINEESYRPLPEIFEVDFEDIVSRLHIAN